MRIAGKMDQTWQQNSWKQLWSYSNG